MKVKIQRAGFYVNGRWYSPACRAQAYARSRYLSAEYGRSVPVTFRPDSFVQAAKESREPKSLILG